MNGPGCRVLGKKHGWRFRCLHRFGWPGHDACLRVRGLPWVIGDKRNHRTTFRRRTGFERGFAE